MRDIAVVTGGAGFIGSHLTDALIDEGFAVRVLDDLSAGTREHVHAQAELTVGSVLDPVALGDVTRGARYVFHLAADPRVQNSIDQPEKTHEVNVHGSLNVLQAARASGVERVVFASSAAVYGDQAALPFTEDMTPAPLSPYGLHKLIGEHYARLWSLLYDVPTVSLRYFNVYGTRFDPHGAYPLVIGFFLDRLRQGKTLPVTGDGTNTRDYVHVRDVAAANIAAAQSAHVGKGDVLNVGSGTEYSVLDLAHMLGGQVEYVPARVEPTAVRADITRAQELLGWAPTVTLEEGVRALRAEYVE